MTPAQPDPATCETCAEWKRKFRFRGEVLARSQAYAKRLERKLANVRAALDPLP